MMELGSKEMLCTHLVHQQFSTSFPLEHLVQNLLTYINLVTKQIHSQLNDRIVLSIVYNPTTSHAVEEEIC